MVPVFGSDGSSGKGFLCISVQSRGMAHSYDWFRFLNNGSDLGSWENGSDLGSQKKKALTVPAPSC